MGHGRKARTGSSSRKGRHQTEPRRATSPESAPSGRRPDDPTGALELQRQVGNTAAQTVRSRSVARDRDDGAEGPSGNVGTVPMGGGTCRIQEGDTLAGLAARHYGSEEFWPLLWEANDEHFLPDGTPVIDMRLRVPRHDLPAMSSAGDRGGAAPQGLPALSTPASVDPRLEAIACTFPELGYSGELLRQEQTVPVASPPGMLNLRCVLEADLTAKQAGSCSPYTVDPDAYKVKLSHAVDEFQSSLQGSISDDGRSVSLGSSISGPLGATGISFDQTGRLTASASGQSVEIDIGGVILSGKLEVKLSGLFVPAVPVRAPARSRVRVTNEQLAMAAAAVGTVIVIGVAIKTAPAWVPVAGGAAALSFAFAS